MSRIHNIQTTSLHTGIGILLSAALTLSGASFVQANSAVPLLDTVNSAKEISDLLFPVKKRRTRSLKLTDHTIEPPPEAVALKIPFAFDSATLLPDAFRVLDFVAEALLSPQAFDQGLIVEGHTDSTGSADYNHRLSVRRAAAVRHYLSSHYGIDTNRLVIKGFGESRPYDASSPSSSINRRVQMISMPLHSMAEHPDS